MDRGNIASCTRQKHDHSSRVRVCLGLARCFRESKIYPLACMYVKDVEFLQLLNCSATLLSLNDSPPSASLFVISNSFLEGEGFSFSCSASLSAFFLSSSANLLFSSCARLNITTKLSRIETTAENRQNWSHSLAPGYTYTVNVG